MPAIIILLILLLLVAIYFYAIAPSTSRKKQCREFTAWDFAHRGLFQPDQQIPENSLAAFSKAITHGYGIELDVQLTKDKELVVFHDWDLKRMCGIEKKVSQMSLDELTLLSLNGTEHRIPSLREVLQLVDGQVPLLIELKQEIPDNSIASVFKEEMRNYKGSYCVESFNPLILRWMKENFPIILRGQLSGKFSPKDLSNGLLRIMASGLMFNFLSRPDFIAFDHRYVRYLGFRLNKKIFQVPTFGWTVKSQRAYDRSRKIFDTLIFDSFEPEEKNK